VFTGALAASFYGVPRTTSDADVVVDISEEGSQTKLVLALRKAGLKTEENRICAALGSGFRIATFRGTKTPFTVDVILSDGKIEKKAGTVLDLPTFFQTPEELILAKLRMIKATVPRERASKDEDDIKAILKFNKVDMNAIKRRARKNGTLSILEALRTDAGWLDRKRRARRWHEKTFR
jgi:hypothetical protein